MRCVNKHDPWVSNLHISNAIRNINCMKSFSLDGNLFNMLWTYFPYFYVKIKTFSRSFEEFVLCIPIFSYLYRHAAPQSPCPDLLEGSHAFSYTEYAGISDSYIQVKSNNLSRKLFNILQYTCTQTPIKKITISMCNLPHVPEYSDFFHILCTIFHVIFTISIIVDVFP